MAGSINMTFDRRGGFGAIGPRTRKLLERAVQKATLEVERAAKIAINTGPKTGRIYRGETNVSFTTGGGQSVSFTAYKGNKKVHQASAPGEAPATDTGTLANSIQSDVSRALLEGTIRVTAQYAAVLEFGGLKMAARPFLRPATAKVKPKFVFACAQAMKSGAKP